MKRVIFSVFVIVAFSAWMFAGVQWSSQITVTDNEKEKSEVFTSTAFAQGGDVKQMFTDVPRKQRGQYIEEGYWLYKGSEDTLYIVDDKEKSITPLSLDGLMQMSRIAAELVKIEISDYSSSTETLAGETVMGYPCSHLRIVTDYTMTMKIAVIKKTFVIHEEKEIWASPAVKGINDISQAFLRKDFRTGFPELDEMIETEMKRMKDLGFALKTVVRTVQKNKKGKVKDDSTTTTEITQLETKNLPPALFELPEGYARNDADAGMF